jgi:hypothetical protein
MICPLLSKSGSEPLECLKDQCAWYIPNSFTAKELKGGYCAVVQIALWMPPE